MGVQFITVQWFYYLYVCCSNNRGDGAGHCNILSNVYRIYLKLRQIREGNPINVSLWIWFNIIIPELADSTMCETLYLTEHLIIFRDNALCCNFIPWMFMFMYDLCNICVSQMTDCRESGIKQITIVCMAENATVHQVVNRGISSHYLPPLRFFTTMQ